MLHEQSNLSSIDADQLLGEVAGEFFDRLAQGEHPSIDEYTERFPQIAHMIRELFPALELIEESASPHVSLPADESQRQLGDFRIGRELGRGGMGVVYQAEQISMGRTVALKVLPFAAVMDQKAITRFKNEARAAGTLHHDNIVPIHAVGNERGVYYYAMALIEGLTIAEVIHELRRGKLAGKADVHDPLAIDDIVTSKIRAASPATKSSGPSGVTEGCPETQRVNQAAASTRRSVFGARYFEQVAQIGCQAADALHHAHERGIVHRDIKPGNLMVDDSGKLWVTDFGLARIGTDPAMTMTGDILGTIRYMAPEQALANRVVVDQRADIYSLGVTLYELLTLQPMFDGADRETLLRQLTFEEPRSPRQLQPRVPSDLDTIVSKAISKCPDDRYTTAEEFADDLRAFCQDQPIKARPLSLPQRGRRWAARHQTLVIAAAAVLLVSTLAMTVSTLLVSRKHTQTQAALEEANRQRQRAEENFERARTTVDTYLTDVSQNQLLNTPGMQPLRRKLLELALQYYERFLQERGAEPDLQREYAATLDRVGGIRSTFGEHEEAKRLHRQAFVIRKRLAEMEPENAEAQHALAESYLLVSLGERSSADKVRQLRHAARIAEPLDHPAHQETLATAYHLLGGAKHTQFRDEGGTEKMTEARAAYSRAVRILETLKARGHSRNRPELLPEVYSALATWHREMGAHGEAQELFSKALKSTEELASFQPGNLRFQESLEFHYWNTRQFEKSVEVSERLMRENPLVDKYQVRLAEVYGRLARLRAGEPGKEEDAIRWAEQSLSLLKRLSVSRPDDQGLRARVGAQHRILGAALLSANRSEEALVACKAAIDELTESGIQKGELADAYLALSRAYERAGQQTAAIETQREQLRVQRELPDTQLHFYTVGAINYRRLGELLRDNQQLDEAVDAYRQAVELLETKFDGQQGPDGTSDQLFNGRKWLADTWAGLARCCAELKRHPDAAKAYRQVIATEIATEHAFPGREMNHLQLDRSYRGLCDALSYSGREAEVVTTLEALVTEWRAAEDAGGDRDACQIQVLGATLRLAAWLAKAGRQVEADLQLQASHDTLQRLLERGDNTLHDALVFCVSCWQPNNSMSHVEQQVHKLVTRHLPAALEMSRTRVKQEPSNWSKWEDWHRLALAYYRQAKWEGVDREVQLALDLASNEPNKLHMFVPLLLLVDKDEEYQQVCDTLIKRWQEWTGYDLGSAAVICSYARQSPKRPETLLKLANRAVEEGPEWAAPALARVNVRLGKFERSLQRLTAGETGVSRELDFALLHVLAGDHTEAQDWYDKAVVVLCDWNSDYANPRTEVEVLRQEVAERIGANASP